MKIDRNTATVLVVVVVAIVAALLAGPEELRADVLAALGVAGSLVLAVLRPMLTRDTDGDGIPDVVDDDPKGDR